MEETVKRPLAAAYADRIDRARVYDVAIRSPLDFATRLSARLDNTVLFKREDLHPVFSFKLRGAYNKIAHLDRDALTQGVVCSSAGNHAQGVALAAQRHGARAVVVMPKLTPVHPFSDPDVIAGQGTIAKELLTQLDEPPDAILFP